MARTGRGDQKIKIAIAGVGNCASSLLQGIEYYGQPAQRDGVGLMHTTMGGYGPGAVEVVAAFDVDRRKVGRPLHEAAFAALPLPSGEREGIRTGNAARLCHNGNGRKPLFGNSRPHR